jgi:diguanylate cyclase (GGDEF)-like protein
MSRADGGLPGVPPTKAGLSPVRSVEDPRMPYLVLSWMLGISAALALLIGVLPGNGETLRAVDIVAAVLLGIGAVLVRLVGDRLPNGLTLDIAVGVGIAIAFAGTLAVPAAVGQLLVGTGLVLYGVYIAYFRPPRRVAWFLVAMVGSYVVALLINRQLRTPVDAFIICLVIVSVTVMVSRLVSALRALALRDSLTGVLNRRGLDLVAGPLAAAAARSGQPISVGLIDLDSFKAYNDEHGHVAGDAALVAIVDAWRTELRASDVLARYGGDEFALLLPGTRVQDAEELAGRLAAVHELHWTAGFVEWTPQEDLYAALGRADTLMFERKPKRTS